MKQIILIITAIIILGSPLRAQETTAADLMTKGLYEENINGDYVKAGEYYQKILDEFGGEKKIAAQASLNLAIIKESLGKLNEAHDQYKKTMEEYPNEAKIVTEAQNRFTNSSGVSYFIDPRDNHSYKYVRIGSQSWMAENLAYIPYVGPVNEQGGIWVFDYQGKNTEEAKKHTNYKNYGCLYDYKTAVSACPPSWHLPTTRDWERLEQFLGYWDVVLHEPNKMTLKDNQIVRYITSRNSSPSDYLVNHTGLDLKHGGSRLHSSRAASRFFRVNSIGKYWGSANDNDGNPITFGVHAGGHNKNNTFDHRLDGYSIRCIKDESEEKPKKPKGLEFVFIQNDTIKLGYSILQVAVSKDDIVDSVLLFIEDQGINVKLGVDYSSILSDNRQSRSSKQYYFGWDTRKYMDGSYDLFAIGYYYGGFIDTTKVNLTVNNVSSTKEHLVFIDTRDNRSYPYTKVGDQIWMTKNMNINIDDAIGSFCYKNLDAHCQNYGRLYTFETAQKVCPQGWHLPTYDDWKQLEIYLGFDTVLLEDERYYLEDSTGAELKAGYGWRPRYNNQKNKWTENSNGANSSHLSFLPTGYMRSDGSFTGMFEHSNYWINSLTKQGYPEIRQLYNFLDCIGRDYESDNYYAAAVRCIKD